MKILMYTANLGDYDNLNIKKDKRFDYIVFSDENISDYIQIENLKPAIQSRYFKFNYFNSNYDILIWFDANIEIKNYDELYKLCFELYNSNYSSLWFKHPQVSSIHDEIENIKKAKKKCNFKGMEKFKRSKKNINYMVSAALHLKKNDMFIKCIMQEIYIYYLYLLRDQPTIPHVFNKNKYTNFCMISNHIFNSITNKKTHKMRYSNL